MTDRIDKAINATEITRRTFIAGTSLAGFAAFLAACGTPGTSTKPSTAASTAPQVTAGPTAAPTEIALPTGGGTLNFANWIGYIDVAEDGTTHPTLDKFTEE